MTAQKTKKRFFSSHAKSSALVVSLVIHAILIVVAVSFVAVTVITKEEQQFEAKPVKRPRMPPKRLQVPVKVNKKPKPKLRKRLVVKTVNRKVPEIRMPEITGVKGGTVGMGGEGGMESIGFSLPEFSIFGTKAKGEKIFIVLDASAPMMIDEMGGIPAYTIIKSELVRILGELDSSVLFNIAVYGGGNYTRFPTLVPASPENVAKVEAWLKPLNAVSSNMGDRDYGARTLGSGGIRISEELSIEPLKGSVGEWAKPTLLAMKQQADVIFVLTSNWGILRYKESDAKTWSESKRKRWEENIAKARGMFEKENKRRREKGQPPRVIPYGNWGLVRTYLPDAPLPPQPSWHNYTPKEMLEALVNTRRKWESKALPSSKLGGKKKEKYSINVIHFVRADSDSNQGAKEKFSKLVGPTRGDYRSIEGLEAIKSYVTGSGE
ncbi:MAG: hypothetical protein KAU94_06005 [Verrucomicrobia bacterium]|nr:hypothetical protein [Verrucomicrobiota bacterium]